MSTHPIQFLGAIARTLAHDAPDLAGQFIGRFGYLAVRLPRWAILAYLGLLLALALTQSNTLAFRLPQRLVLAVVAIGSLVSLFALVWAFEAPRPLIAQLGDGATVPSMQGRYFISFCLPAFLLLSNRRWRIAPRFVSIPAFLLIAAVNLSAFDAIWRAFYSPPPSDPRALALATPDRRVFGIIDIPQPGALVDRTFTVAGWAVAADSNIAKVRVYIDGQFQQEAVYGSRRPDIEAAYPDAPGAGNAGFNLRLNLDSLPPADHILSVQAESRSGTTAMIGQQFMIHIQ